MGRSGVEPGVGVARRRGDVSMGGNGGRLRLFVHGGGDVAGLGWRAGLAFVTCAEKIVGLDLLLAAHPQLTGSSWNTF